MIKLIDVFENCKPGAVNENRAGEKPCPVRHAPGSARIYSAVFS